jgi:hypothetical protein
MLACAAGLVLFAILAWSAVSRKSATYDEPLHVVTGWMNLYVGDYRLSPDVPPLWEYWITLSMRGDALFMGPVPSSVGLDYRAIRLMYQTPGVDGVALVRQARMMALPLAIFLAALAAKWAWDLAGPVAAVVTTTVFALDPNWLGNAPLAKNDVAFALVYFMTAYFVWRIGRRANRRGLLAILLMPALCLGVKLSGLAVIPVIALMLGVRSLMSAPWPFVGKSLTTCSAKTGIAASVILLGGLLAYGGLWAQYGFRFDAAPRGLQLDIDRMASDLRAAEVGAQFQINQPTPAQLATWEPGAATRVMLWLGHQRLAPQAWVYGFLYTKYAAASRQGYLLGHLYTGGRWYYFPLAWLFKEPVSLIAAAILVAIVGARTVRKQQDHWTTCAIALPAIIYLAAAMAGNLNIGLRHILPVFPFIDVAIGLAAAKLWNERRLVRPVMIFLGLGLAAETISAYPDFIAFFNFPSGGERGGIRLLGDSNLDWGQDLPALAAWQSDHPHTPLYLEYFGTCDPTAYGIRFINTRGGYVYGPPPQPPTLPGVAAISACKLQGLFSPDPANDFAAQFRTKQPIAVLGGSIYLFDYSAGAIRP